MKVVGEYFALTIDEFEEKYPFYYGHEKVCQFLREIEEKGHDVLIRHNFDQEHRLALEIDRVILWIFHIDFQMQQYVLLENAEKIKNLGFDVKEIELNGKKEKVADFPKYTQE